MTLRSVPECSHVIVDSAAGGTIPVIAAVSGLGVNIYRLILTVPSAVDVEIQDTAGNSLSQNFAFGSSGGSITVDTPINGDPWWSAATGLGIQLDASAAVLVSADIYYIQGVAQGVAS